MSSSVRNTTGQQASIPSEMHAVRPLRPLPPAWRSLAHAFVGSVRDHWSDPAVCDGTGASLTYGQTLVRATVLGRFLARTMGAEPFVGVLLPPMVPAAVVNLALVLQGKIPVNLNYTAGQEMIDSAIAQCGIKHVITSPKVLDKFQVKPTGDAAHARGGSQADPPRRQAGRRGPRLTWCATGSWSGCCPGWPG